MQQTQEQIERLRKGVNSAYEAIKQKGGITPADLTLAGIPAAIGSISASAVNYTGNVDKEGLSAIGWRNEDIEWLKTRVDWMAEDDELYKVPQKLIDVYIENGRTWNGELITAHKSQPYYRWCPYFEPNEMPSSTNGLRHNNAYYIIGFPKLNFPSYEFYNFFTNCQSLKFIPEWCISSCDISSPVTEITFNHRDVNLNTKILSSVIRIIKNAFGTFSAPNSIYLKELKLVHAYGNCDFYMAVNLPKEEILYMIEESDGNPATITLDPFLLERMQADANVQNALNNYPNITLTTK